MDYFYRVPDDVKERWTDIHVKALLLGTTIKEVISYLLLEWVDEDEDQ